MNDFLSRLSMASTATDASRTSTLMEPAHGAGGNDKGDDPISETRMNEAMARTDIPGAIQTEEYSNHLNEQQKSNTREYRLQQEQNARNERRPINRLRRAIHRVGNRAVAFVRSLIPQGRGNRTQTPLRANSVVHPVHPSHDSFVSGSSAGSDQGGTKLLSIREENPGSQLRNVNRISYGGVTIDTFNHGNGDSVLARREDNPVRHGQRFTSNNDVQSHGGFTDIIGDDNSSQGELTQVLNGAQNDAASFDGPHGPQNEEEPVTLETFYNDGSPENARLTANDRIYMAKKGLTDTKMRELLDMDLDDFI